jgi:hypothetical protein
MFVTVLLSACVGKVGFCEDLSQAARELEKRAVAYRQSMDQMRVVWEITCLKDSLQPVREKVTDRLTIWAKGRKLRTDLQSNGPGKNERLEQYVLTENTFIDTLDTRLPVEFLRVKDHPTQGYVFHPRILGMYPWTTVSLHQFSLNELFGRQDRIIRHVVKEERNGSEVWRVTSMLASRNVLFPSWIDPSKGPSVIGMVTESGDGKTKLRQELDVVCAKFGRRGVWYPQKVSYHYSDGKKVSSHEEIVTRTADFDTEIPDSTFQLAALGLPPGRSVLIDNWRNATWDGKKLIESIAPPPPSPESQSSSRFRGIRGGQEVAVHFSFGVPVRMRGTDGNRKNDLTSILFGLGRRKAS